MNFINNTMQDILNNIEFLNLSDIAFCKSSEEVPKNFANKKQLEEQLRAILNDGINKKIILKD